MVLCIGYKALMSTQTKTCDAVVLLIGGHVETFEACIVVNGLAFLYCRT